LAQLQVYENIGFPIHKRDTVFCTCFIAFFVSHSNEQVYDFLDVWYEQTLRHTTQDQIGFPFCLWRQSLRCHTWHGTPHSRTHMFVKHHHHQ
jgi:hypothetical protein